jgi:hypothetical protein
VSVLCGYADRVPEIGRGRGSTVFRLVITLRYQFIPDDQMNRSGGS